jgi:hypothetical protein
MTQLKTLSETKVTLGVDELDAIAFVVLASRARLTARQRYIFDSILSIFGRDAIENFVIMATFADSKTPQGMNAIQGQNIIFKTVW